MTKQVFYLVLTLILPAEPGLLDINCELSARSNLRMDKLLALFGLVLAHILNRRLQRTLLGYNPEQFSKMFIEREEVMDALEEGILAINTEGEIITMNRSVLQILDLDEAPPTGTKLADIFPDTVLYEIIESQTPTYNRSFRIAGKDILANQIPIVEGDEVVGAVSICRNKTALNKLAAELTGSKYMVDTLRAFNHEFKNKLHVILGYIEVGQADKAADLIRTSSLVSTQAVSEITQKVQIPDISALLIGKMIRANELGIHFSLKADTQCFENQSSFSSDLYITILGNLIENACEELDQSGTDYREICVGIHMCENCTILSVDDTGRGIPEEIRDKIFKNGFSTKGEHRGTGLYLISDIVNRYHGSLSIDTAIGEGTSITVTL